MKIAVLGGGHGCYAAAADLSEAGHEVRLWRRDGAALQPLIEAGSIRLKDHAGARDIKIALATPDIGKAIHGAELIVLPTPATAQHDIAVAMAPHLQDGQVIFLPPGTFGSWYMAQVVRATGQKADVAFAETGTLPWLARKHGSREINITIRAVRLPVGVYPERKSAHTIAVIQKAFPVVHPCGDALSGALMNAGPIIHPPLMIMNAAPLQHFERWDIHAEGTQPAVRAVTNSLDNERIAVRKALGYGEPHYPLVEHYTTDRWMYGDSHKRLVDSGDWREHIDLHTHRYIREDVVTGLAFLASVARWSGTDAPVAHGILALVGSILGEDILRGPRTLEGLGLDKLSRQELQHKLHSGN